ncbi:hypothetical protein AMAG_17942 [Allomyces macrogynus ATCC 38327]|uniref:Uncharacterized protein n=1 Tax=Allomyces macrogynus (strain ATCC 38327) TaxID=578462 RepID=A0A0L0S219_ALLM3|nr:hypothetical protein AMAG_17942 [Allomyces macrogynus ATCC 38327]|eukprot:KNE56617.1 hypothetical protein AMAG_17942 [Allomyces macrogynus ATCC 38327]
MLWRTGPARRVSLRRVQHPSWRSSCHGHIPLPPPPSTACQHRVRRKQLLERVRDGTFSPRRAPASQDQDRGVGTSSHDGHMFRPVTRTGVDHGSRGAIPSAPTTSSIT